MDTSKMFDTFLEATCSFIDARSRDNDMREDYWRMMSANKWLNRDIDKLVHGLIDFVILESSNLDRNTQIERILPALIDKWVLLDMSAWALADRQIANSLDDQVFKACQRSVEELDYILDDIEEYNRNSRNRDDRSRGRNDRNDRSRDGGGNDRGLRGGARQGERGSVTRGMASRGNSASSRNNQGQADHTGAGRVSGGVGSMLGSKERSAHEVRSLRDREQAPEPERTRAPEPEREPVPRSARGERPSSRQQQSQKAIDGPDFTLAHPYDEFYSAGDCWQPQHKSKWELSPLTWAFAEFLTAFNPRKKMRFFVKDQSNNVREELRDMSADTDYLRHELKPAVRVRVTDPDLKTVKVEDKGYVSPGAIPLENKQLVRGCNQSTELHSEHVNVVASRDEGEMVAMFEQTRVGGQNTVYNYCVTTPIWVKSTNLDIELNKIADSANLTDAVGRMLEAEASMDPAVWDYLNGRFTKLVNHVTRNVYGLPAKIKDFVNDYVPLIEWMKTRDRQVANDYSLFARYIPKLVVTRLSEDSRRNWLQSALALSDEEFEAKDPSIVCFETFYSALAVNFTLGDTGLGLTDVSQKLDALDYPMLYALVTKAIEINTRTLENSTLYLLTTDRVRIEVIVSPLNNKQILLRLIQD